MCCAWTYQLFLETALVSLHLVVAAQIAVVGVCLGDAGRLLRLQQLLYELLGLQTVVRVVEGLRRLRQTSVRCLLTKHGIFVAIYA